MHSILQLSQAALRQLAPGLRSTTAHSNRSTPANRPSSRFEENRQPGHRRGNLQDSTVFSDCEGAQSQVQVFLDWVVICSQGGLDARRQARVNARDKISDEQMSKIKSAFRAFDRDGSGKLL